MSQASGPAHPTKDWCTSCSPSTMGVDDPTSEVAAAQLYIGLVFSLLGIAVIAFMYLYADRGLFYWHSVG